MQFIRIKTRPVGLKAKIITLVFSFIGSMVFWASYAPEAQASAAFARQTGMSCTHCHTVRAPSMTAIGKMFFIQGYRTHIYSEMEHGPRGVIGSGKEGGSFRLSEQAIQYFWFRTRAIPWRKSVGDAFSSDEESSFAEIPSRFALGFGGPIGDYVSIWNEEYFQPYTETFECEVDIGDESATCEDHEWDATGGNSPEYPPSGGDGTYHWRFSHVEVDELDIVVGKEVGFLPPGNRVDLLISNRGRNYPNARGGSAITNGVGRVGSGNNGSVGLRAYNGSWLWGSLQFLPGNDVAWGDGSDGDNSNGHDTLLTLYFWPWRQNQNDLSFDLYFADNRDTTPIRTRNPLGNTNHLEDSYSVNLRTNWVMADVGPHMLDTEITLGYAWEKYSSSDGDVEWTGAIIDPGFRYFWNRTYGIQVEVSLPFLIYEQEVGGETYEYDNNVTWDIELFYAMQPNALWYITFSQAGGGVYCDDCPAGPAEPDDGWTYWLLLELNY
jgi:hypothetical protein